ncbi:MAG: TolC family protein [Chitinophagaceae bacterium]
MITQYIMRKYLMTFAVFCGTCTGLYAQRNVLDDYIDSAIAHNIVIQKKSVALDKARLSFDIAKSYYRPTTSFLMDYQYADGGRDIQLPLGDLLNGVYSTLNQLTSSNSFPQLANQSINFLPKNFYDARVHTTLPLYNPDIKYNKQLAAEQIQLSQLDIAVYKKDLIKNTKEAYFNYLLALQVIAVYKESLSLAEEGRRTNQKLLDNGKGLPAYVIRSESEVENFKAEINSAVQKAKNAALYFNFLLNRNLDAPIDTNYNAQQEADKATTLLMRDANVAEREEIKSLEQVSQINKTTQDMNKSAFYPRLNSFLDLGSQAQNWKVNGQSKYYLFGVQLSVPIYSGLRTKNKIRQAEFDMKNTQLDISQATQQLSMADKAAKNELNAAIQTLSAKKKQLDAAATYQRLINRGYREGSNTFIETIDARNQYTQAHIAQQMQVFQVLISATDVERNLSNSHIQK